MGLERFFSERAWLMKASEVRELLKWIGRDVISLGGGIPDPSSFPIEDLREIFNHILLNESGKALQYGVTEGVYELREELARFVGRRGIKAEANNVLVTVGSQESIELLARILVDPGDIVVTENPTYLAALQVFRVYRPRLIGVPLDDEGMRVDLLEEKLRELRSQGRRVKMVYTIPTCQNPTGISMSDEKRKRLVELAEEYDFLIVEDDPYSYFLFEDVDRRLLKSMDDTGRIIYLSTSSKILAPGLRIGWTVADETIVSQMAMAKQAVTLHTPTLSQYVLLEALKRGVIEKQLPLLRRLYREKRDAMLKALDEHMPENVEWTKPLGGMFIWLKTPEKLDMKKLLPEALTKYKVGYVPGSAFHVDGGGHNTARLSYTYPPMDDIREAVARLAKMIIDHL